MKIRITKGRGWYRNEVDEVFEVTGRCEEWDAYYVKVWHDEHNKWVTDSYFVSDGYCEVVEEDQAHESIEDIIANLVRRVASLESQLRDTQNNVERQGVEIAEVAQGLSETSYDISRLYVRSDIDNVANEIARMIRHGGAR